MKLILTEKFSLILYISSVQFSSVSQSCPTLCNPMNCSTPDLPVHHQLLEFTQTHVHQWCHPAISSSVIPFSYCCPSLPASESFPMSQLFPWGGQSTGVSALASFLPKKSQGWSPYKAVLFPVFKGISTLFSIVAVLVCIPTNSVRGFPFLHTLSSIYCLYIFMAMLLLANIKGCYYKVHSRS